MVRRFRKCLIIDMGAACTTQNIPRKVLLTGPKQSGKTTLLYAWCLQLYNTEVQSTLSFNVETVHGHKSGQVLLVFDVTDTVRRRQFYHGTDAIVYVVDGSDESSLVTAQDDLKTVLNDRDLKQLPFILVISKQDIQSSKISDIEDRLGLSDELNSRKYKCSHVQKDNLSTYTTVLQELCALLYNN